MPNHIETLIADVLAYSRPSGSGCFVTNAAADDLLKCGQAALNEIEGAIRALLAQSDRSASHDELLEAQLGLLDLWMVYFQLAEGNDLERAVVFLGSLSGPLLATAILAMTPTWRRESGVVIPGPILEFVRDVALHGTGCAAEVARYHLP